MVNKTFYTEKAKKKHKEEKKESKFTKALKEVKEVLAPVPTERKSNPEILIIKPVAEK